MKIDRMAKSSSMLELKNQPNWLVRIVTLFVLLFVFSLLSAVASGLWNWLIITTVVFIIALMLLYGAYFFAETIETALAK